tara:strand:+ start:1495 stop:2151 length:657 start_codon:yes stop_codon:yes gene_type:complete
MTQTFAHEEAFRGEDLLKVLDKQLVTVCGVGTLGSPLVDTLPRQGFNTLRAIDMDKVEQHNINTQIYGLDEIGKLKVAALQKRVFRSTRVQVETFNTKLTNGNVKKLLAGSALVIDAFDNTESRQIVQNHCRANKLPCLHAGLFEGYGEVVWDEDYNVPQAPSTDVEDVEDACENPLARNLASIIATMAAEEAMRFFFKDELHSRSFMLKSFSIRPYK